MRILLVHSSFAARGGAELYVLRLAHTLQDRGHAVHVASRHPPTAADRGELTSHQFTGAHVYDPDQPTGDRRPALARALWHLTDPLLRTARASLGQALRSADPDVVHSHNLQGIGGGALSVLRTRPQVHTVHDYALVDPRTTLTTGDGRVRTALPAVLRLRAAVWRRQHRPDLYVFPDQRVLDLHRQVGWHSGQASTTVLAHGWALEDPRSAAAAGPPERPRAASAPRPRPGGTRFLYLGRLDPHKGLALLLEAWRLAGLEEAELWVCGRGPLEDRVRALERAGCGLRYGGFVTGQDKTAALQRADVLVFPSQWPETFGLVCAEALLAGTPVLASVQASPPVVNDGVNGRLVDGPASAWALALQTLHRDPVAVAALAQGARESATALDWTTHVDRVEALYGSVQA